MIQVIPVPAFTDNYIWFITRDAESIPKPNINTATLDVSTSPPPVEIDSESDVIPVTHNTVRRPVAIVDPGDAEPVLKALETYHLTPCAILITHHHRDHIGGIAGILEHYPSIPVYGPSQETIPHLTHAVNEGHTIALQALNLELQVLDVHGHTAGHIAYHGAGKLFCGDTLFANGCGRVFDGTLEDLHASLQKIAQLPHETQVYCAHEYTVDNIGFAKWVEPDNQDIDARLEASWDLLDNGHGTVPFELGNEFATNPFLRTHIPEVIAKAEKVAGRETHTSAEVFAVLRIWKDTEYD